MTSVVPISRREERLEAACRWIVRLDEGLSGGDEAELRAWLAEHPGNPVDFVETAQAWDKLDCLSQLADIFPIEQSLARATPLNRLPQWPAAAWLAAAACVLVLVACTWFIAPQWYSGEQSRERLTAQAVAMYQTAIGEHRTVKLSDGTTVTLNTDSRVSVAYSASARLLELVRGEIHVEVVPDPVRPFSVIAGDRVVQAVGTAFSVELTANRGVEVVVTKGEVLVGVRVPRSHTDLSQVLITPGLREAAATETVSAGHELIARAAEETIVPVSPEDIEAELAWRDGRLIFRDEALEQAIAEIERYTTVDFVFLDESLKQQPISGRYKAGDVEELLLALRGNFDIHYEYDGANRVLLRKL